MNFFYPPYDEESSKFQNEVLRVTRAFFYSKWARTLGWQVNKENGVDVTEFSFLKEWGG